MGADDERPADEAGQYGHASMVGAMLRASFMDMYEREQPRVLDELLARLAAETNCSDATLESRPSDSIEDANG